MRTAVQATGQVAARLAEVGQRGKFPVVPGFKFLALLGEGGMGVVYHVEQVGLKRQAALKMILGGQYSDVNNRKRFQVEAEAIAQLKHPNVVQVYGFGEHDGSPYLTLEYVDGGTLGQALRRAQPLGAAAIAGLLATIADGVAHAHEKGIIHRDLKPINILLTQQGVPKVADFGLARLANQDLTITGAMLGTPSYMAPEQATGRARDIGPASDVYSLGAILFEMLTGRPPFVGATSYEILTQVIADEPPSVRSLSSKVPRDLETICLKCLAKEPGQRYATAAQLAADLRRWQTGEPIAARRASVAEKAWKRLKRNKSTAAAMTAIIAAAAVVAGVLAFTPKPNLPPQPDAPPAVDDKGQFDAFADRGLRLLEEGDPSGSLLWLARADAAGKSADPARVEANRVRMKHIAARITPLVHRFRHAAKVTATEFSPDGKALLTASEDRTAVVWDLTTRRERWRNDFVSPPTFAAFSADGQKVVVVTKDRHAHVYDSRSGQRIGAALSHPVSINVATFSPDGTRLATGGGAVLYKYAVTVTRSVPVQIKERITVLETVVRLIPDEALGKKEVTEQVPVEKEIVRTVYKEVQEVQERTIERGEREPNFAWQGGLARVWDLASGQQSFPDIEVGDIVNRLAFAPDGRFLAVGLDTFRVGAGPAPPEFKAPAGEVLPKAMPKPSEKSAAPENGDRSSTDGFVFVSTQEPPQPGPESSKELAQPLAPAPSPSSKSPLDPVQFWDISRFQPRKVGVLPDPTRSLPPPPAVDPAAKPVAIPARVAHLSFNAAGHVRAVVDSTTYELDPVTGQMSFEPAFHQYYVKSADIRSDATSGQFLSILVRQGKAELATITTNPPVAPKVALGPNPKDDRPRAPEFPRAPGSRPVAVSLPLKGDVEVLDAIAVGQSGGMVVTSTSDNRLRVWDLASPPQSQLESEPIFLSTAILGIKADPSGNGFAAITADFQVSVWDAFPTHLDPSDVVVRDPTPNRQLALSPDGKYAYTARTGGTIQAWETASGKAVIEGGPNDGVESAVMMGSTLAAVRNGRVEIYRVGRSGPVPRLETKDFPYGNCCVHLSENEKKVFLHNHYPDRSDQIRCLVADTDGTGDPVAWAEPTRMQSATFSADGSRLFLTGFDGTIRVRDAATGKPTSYGEIATGFTGNIVITAHPDGSRLLTLGNGKALKVWDTATGKMVGEPRDLEILNPSSLTFGGGGRLLVVGGGTAAAGAQGPPNSQFQLLDWPTLAARGSLVGQPGRLPFAAVSPDGTFLFTTTQRDEFDTQAFPQAATQAYSRLWEVGPSRLTPMGPASFRTNGDVVFTPTGELLHAFPFGNDWVVSREKLKPITVAGDELNRLVAILALREIDATGDMIPLKGQDLADRLAKAHLDHKAPSEEIAKWRAQSAEARLEYLTRSGFWAEADSLARGLVVDDRLSPAGWLLVGDTRAAHRDWSGAANAFEKAIRANVDVPKARVKLALVRLAAGDDKGASAALDPILRLPCHKIAFALKALTADLSRDELQQLMKSIDSPRSNLVLAPADGNHTVYGYRTVSFAKAVISLQLNQPDDAMELHNRFDASPAELTLSAVSYRLMDDNKQAIAIANVAERQLLSPPSGAPAVWGWEQRVLTEVVRGRVWKPLPLPRPRPPEGKPMPERKAD